MTGSLDDRQPIAVLVVDDQPAVREGLARLIACGVSPLRSVTAVGNGSEALAVAARLRPELVVLDVDLGGEDGLALIPQLIVSAHVLVLTSHGDAMTRGRARQLGARAFVEKHAPASTLLACIAELAFPGPKGEEGPGRAGPASQGAAGPSSAAPQHRRP